MEYRWHWVPNATFSHWACTFHVVYINFICVGHPTQTRFSVEYGLYTLHRTHKGPYPLGDIDMIVDRIGRRRSILSPILSVITLWVWHIYWVTGQLVAGRQKYRRFISSMFDISLPTSRPAMAVTQWVCPLRAGSMIK